MFITRTPARHAESPTYRLRPLEIHVVAQKAANARELDILKRNTFNTRNELGNAFRTMLHDVKMSYQSQAFDAMVREATT